MTNREPNACSPGHRLRGCQSTMLCYRIRPPPWPCDVTQCLRIFILLDGSPAHAVLDISTLCVYISAFLLVSRKLGGTKAVMQTESVLMSNIACAEDPANNSKKQSCPCPKIHAYSVAVSHGSQASPFDLVISACATIHILAGILSQPIWPCISTGIFMYRPTRTKQTPLVSLTTRRNNCRRNLRWRTACRNEKLATKTCQLRTIKPDRLMLTCPVCLHKYFTVECNSEIPWLTSQYGHAHSVHVTYVRPHAGRL